MVRLFHLNIPKAVDATIKIASQIERQAEQEFRGDHRRVLLSLAQDHFRLAERIDRGDFLSLIDVQGLIKTHSFLKECQL